MDVKSIKKDVKVDGQTMEVEYLNFDVGDNPFGIHWTLWDKITIPFHVAEDPLHAVARGTGVALKNVNNFGFLIR